MLSRPHGSVREGIIQDSLILHMLCSSGPVPCTPLTVLSCPNMVVLPLYYVSFGTIIGIVGRMWISHDSIRTITKHWACAEWSALGDLPNFQESRYHRSGGIAIARCGDLLPGYDRNVAMKKFWERRARDIWPKGRSRGCRWLIQETISFSE